MWKIIIKILIFLFFIPQFSSEYIFQKIFDIGSSLKNYNSNIFLTEIGFFYDDDFKTPFKTFTSNVKKCLRTDSFFVILYENNFLEIYSLDSVPFLLYSDYIDSGIKSIFASENYIIFNVSNTLNYLYSFQNGNLLKIKNFNITNINDFYSNKDKLFFVTNESKIIKFGEIIDTIFYNKNFLANDNTTALFFNRFNTIITTTDGKNLLFMRIENDSLKPLYNVPDNRIYERCFDVDSFLVLKNSDSLFIRIVIDSFVTFSVDSFEFKDDLVDLFIENDTLFINTGSRILKYPLGVRNLIAGQKFTKNLKGILNNGNLTGFYSDDSFYTFIDDSIISVKNKNRQLFQNQEILVNYYQIIFGETDSFSEVGIDFVVKNVKNYKNGFFILDNNLNLKYFDREYYKLKNVYTSNYDFIDLEREGDSFFLVSGQNGIFIIDTLGKVLKTFIDGSFYHRIVSYRDTLVLISDFNNIKFFYRDLSLIKTFYISEFKNIKSLNDTGIIVITKDSLIYYRNNFEKMNLKFFDLKNVKDVILKDSNKMYLLLRNGAVLIFKLDFVNTREKNEKPDNTKNTLKIKKLWYDITGRKIFDLRNRKIIFQIDIDGKRKILRFK